MMKTPRCLIAFTFFCAAFAAVAAVAAAPPGFTFSPLPALSGLNLASLAAEEAMTDGVGQSGGNPPGPIH